MRSCLDTAIELTEQGIDFDWMIRWNESLVHRARMGMTKAFLDTDFKYMMWLDADIEFTPSDVASLWNMDADIAVGVYRMKTDDSQYAAWVGGKLVTDLEQFEEPIEVDYAGTGFMLIKRGCLEALAKRVPTYENELKGIPALYQTPIRHGTLLSEDYFFCELARDNGYKVMMDPSVKLTHYGLKGYGA
jgi:hypothetical protein